MSWISRAVAAAIAVVLSVAVLPERPSAQQGFGPPPGPGPYLRFRLVRVLDEHGFQQPVEAYRLLVPSDWYVQAWARWRPDIVHCPSNPVETGGRITAPDGVTGLEVFSPVVWQWVDDPQSRQILQQGAKSCPWLPALTAADYLRAALPQARPGAQVVASAPDPRLAGAIDAQMRPWLAPSMQAGFIQGFRVDAARFRLNYSMGGRPVEELVSGAVRVVVQQSPSYGQVAGLGGGPLRTYSATAYPWMAGRAPQGQLDRMTPVFAAVVGSITANLQWVRAVQLVSDNIANIRLRGAIDRAQIWHQAAQEISQIYSQAYANQQRVQGSLAQQYSEGYRGIETFVDRITGERVELSGGFRQAWTNGRGEYILSNDQNFNPGVTLRERWEEMPRFGRQ